MITFVKGTLAEWNAQGQPGIFAKDRFNGDYRQPDLRIEAHNDAPWSKFIGYAVWSAGRTPLNMPEYVLTVQEAVDRGWFTWDTAGEWYVPEGVTAQ